MGRCQKPASSRLVANTNRFKCFIGVNHWKNVPAIQGGADHATNPCDSRVFTSPWVMTDSAHRYRQPMVKGMCARECWLVVFSLPVLIICRALPSVGRCVGVASNCLATSLFFPELCFVSFFCGHALNWNAGICNLVSRAPII